LVEHATENRSVGGSIPPLGTTKFGPAVAKDFPSESLDQKFTGTSVLAAAAPKPTTVYQYKNQDTVALNVRVQPNF
jgi:hypothetical protein